MQKTASRALLVVQTVIAARNGMRRPAARRQLAAKLRLPPSRPPRPAEEIRWSVLLWLRHRALEE